MSRLVSQVLCSYYIYTDLRTEAQYIVYNVGKSRGKLLLAGEKRLIDQRGVIAE